MNIRICAIVGAGPGLGLAIARKFGKKGYKLALLARRPQALANYTTLLAHDDIEAQGFSVDASDPEALASTFEQIYQTLGPPDVLIYNVAAVKLDNPMTLTVDELVQDFKVNVAGALVATQQVVPGMQERGGGTIIFTGNGLAFEAYSQLTSLSIGKAAIRNLSFSLAKALEEDNIHVATVTINSYIQPGTYFDPNEIAEAYWQLHIQPQELWEWETIYE